MATNCKWHILGVRGPILIILMFIVESLGCLNFIALVSETIVRQGHSQKVILKVKFIEYVSPEGFPLSHTKLQWINWKLYTFIKC